MAEQVHPLTLAEDAHVALLSRLRAEAIARANAEFSHDMSVFCVQLKAPDGTRFSYEPAVGSLVPARLVYDDGIPASEASP